jgi:alginate O-acetyltransferase complex protein AlgJ
MPEPIDTLALPSVPPPAPATHPRRDRVVAALFALCLAAPLGALAFTWSRTTTLFEKRAMAPWPAFELVASFPPAFERAFADRFGGRDLLIHAHHASLLRIFGVSGLATVMPGRDGWLYWLGEDGRSLNRHYRGTTPFPQADVDASVAELLRRREWLAARGIVYVVAVVPEKFTIYPEYLPGWVAPSGEPTPYDRTMSALHGHPELAFIDLRPALRSAKERERVYYRTDSHWNYNGAAVAYDAIMREVARLLPPGRLPRVVPAPRPPYVAGTDYYSGDLVTMLGLTHAIREDDVAPLGKVLADAPRRCAQRVLPDPAPGVEVYECARGDLPRTVVMRDSMAIPLIPMLAENFSRALFVSSRQLDPVLIEREKPDVVIEELVERSLHAPGVLPMPR